MYKRCLQPSACQIRRIESSNHGLSYNMVIYHVRCGWNFSVEIRRSNSMLIQLIHTRCSFSRGIFDAPLANEYPTASNCFQQTPTASNSLQQLPKASNSFQQLSTTFNSFQQLPTASNVFKNWKNWGRDEKWRTRLRDGSLWEEPEPLFMRILRTKRGELYYACSNMHGRTAAFDSYCKPAVLITSIGRHCS